MKSTLLTICILLLAACRPPANMPTAHDQTPRLVVLSPAMTIILRDIGAANLIVGRHDFDQLFTNLPACGNQSGIDYETILSLKPTDILIEWGSRDLPPRLLALAHSNHWRLERHELRTLDDIQQTADTLQAEYAPTQNAEPLSASLERAWSHSEVDLAPLGRILLIGATDPPAALGPGSFHHQILQRIGATPAISEGAPWIELGAEDIINLQPDAIILIAPRHDGTGIGALGTSALPSLGLLAKLNVPAVTNKHLAVLDGPLYLTPSTAMADFAKDLKKVLQQWIETPP